MVSDEVSGNVILLFTDKLSFGALQNTAMPNTTTETLNLFILDHRFGLSVYCEIYVHIYIYIYLYIYIYIYIYYIYIDR